MNLLRNFYRLAAPFWLTRQSWKAWLALGSAIACSLLFVQVVVLVARWQKAFFDALSNFGAKEIPQLLLEYLLYLAAMTALIVIGNWILKRLKFAWREHMTVAFERRWLSEHRQYRLQLSGEPDNPDKRIAEDLWLLSELTLNLVKSFCQTMFVYRTAVGCLRRTESRHRRNGNRNFRLSRLVRSRFFRGLHFTDALGRQSSAGA